MHQILDLCFQVYYPPIWYSSRIYSGTPVFLIFISDLVTNIQSEKLILHMILNCLPRLTLQRMLRLLSTTLMLYSYGAINVGSFQIPPNARPWYTRRKLIVSFFFTLSIALFWHLLTLFLNLSFSSHITGIVGQCFKLYGFIYRNYRDFQSVTLNLTLNTLFYSLIRSKLEYAVVICPYSSHIDTTESVQRKFLKFWYYLVENTYPERGFDYAIPLSRFNCSSLYFKRVVNINKFLFHLVHGRID